MEGQNNPEKKSWAEQDALAKPGLITNLIQGRLGLATTYWAYGVLGSIVWIVVVGSLGEDSIISQDLNDYFFGSFAYRHSEFFLVHLTNFGLLFFLAILSYYYIVFTGIWRAATNYSGNKIWSTLAKFFVIVNTAPILASLLKSCMS